MHGQAPGAAERLQERRKDQDLDPRKAEDLGWTSVRITESEPGRTYFNRVISRTRGFLRCCILNQVGVRPSPRPSENTGTSSSRMISNSLSRCPGLTPWGQVVTMTHTNVALLSRRW